MSEGPGCSDTQEIVEKKMALKTAPKSQNKHQGSPAGKRRHYKDKFEEFLFLMTAFIHTAQED